MTKVSVKEEERKIILREEKKLKALNEGASRKESLVLSFPLA